jgi:hypothetical protein
MGKSTVNGDFMGISWGLMGNQWKINGSVGF